MTKLPLFFSVAMLLFLGGCSNNVTINTDYNDEIDFSSFQSYRWYSGKTAAKEGDEVVISDILDARIRSHINDQLSQKGMKIKETGKVDFYINYDVTSVVEIDIETYQTYSGYNRNYSWYGGGYGYGYRSGYHRAGATMTLTGIPTTETEIDEYKKGTLIIDIISAVDDTLVWRGVANGRMSEEVKSAEEREATAQKIIGDIMVNFPP